MPKKYTKDDPGQRKDGQTRTNAIEADERFTEFSRYYVELNGNGYKAALAAGYPADYAKGHAHLLVARLKLKAQPVLRRYGLDEVFVARHLKKLARAKEPKWNPRKLVKPAVMDPADKSKVLEPEVRGDWDKFENAAVQIRAIELVKDMLAMDPPKVLKGEGPGGAIPVTLVHSVPRPKRET